MKAPDIIYINGFSAFATEPVKDGIEYIRKGALIDALNKILEARPPEAKGPASTIAAMVFQQLIEKINSL